MLPVPRTYITEHSPLIQTTSTIYIPAAEDQGIDIIEIIDSALIAIIISLVRVAACPSVGIIFYTSSHELPGVIVTSKNLL